MGLSIGPLHVRRSTFIEATPQAVWQHFTTEDAVKAWLDQGHTVHAFEPALGGKVGMSVEIDRDRQTYGGSIIVWEPEHEVSLESQWDGPMAWPVPTFWTIRLTALYGGTLVELFHHGFERCGASAADELEGYEAGWSTDHLVSLRKLAEQ
jgi:uncharacterized protein YndB with AHSA1/START domain